MKTKKIAFAVCALMLSSSILAVTSEATVGYNQVNIPVDSDTFLTLPFSQKSEGTFTVTGTNSTDIVISGGLTADAFINNYYVRVMNGVGEGLWSTISGNTATNITLEDNRVLSTISNGDSFEIIAHQTLGSVFPNRMASVSFEKTTVPFDRKTEILIPNTTSIGINKSAAATYFFFNDAWRKIGQPFTTSFNSTVLPPQTYFILRNGGSTMLKFIVKGQVTTRAVSRYLDTETAKNDIPAGTGVPVPVTLGQLNLGGTSAFETTTVPFSRKDELFVFDNSISGINKSASATYFYFNGAWRKAGASISLFFDDEVLEPGMALLIRKGAGAQGSSLWFQPSQIN